MKRIYNKYVNFTPIDDINITNHININVLKRVGKIQ